LFIFARSGFYKVGKMFVGDVHFDLSLCVTFVFICVIAHCCFVCCFYGYFFAKFDVIDLLWALKHFKTCFFGIVSLHIEVLLVVLACRLSSLARVWCCFVECGDPSHKCCRFIFATLMLQLCFCLWQSPWLLCFFYIITTFTLQMFLHCGYSYIVIVLWHGSFCFLCAILLGGSNVYVFCVVWRFFHLMIIYANSMRISCGLQGSRLLCFISCFCFHFLCVGFNLIFLQNLVCCMWIAHVFVWLQPRVGSCRIFIFFSSISQNLFRLVFV
jgi:hypothetical protein